MFGLLVDRRSGSGAEGLIYWDLWSGVFSDRRMFLGCFVRLLSLSSRKARCCGMSTLASFSSLGRDSVAFEPQSNSQSTPAKKQRLVVEPNP